MNKTSSATVTIIGLCLLATITANAAAQGAIEIGSIEELQRIGYDPAYPLNGYYVLTRDIDASRTAFWNNGAGFMPVGSRTEDEDDALCFKGWFDGQGHVIRGLVINRPEGYIVGLFGSISRDAVVANVGLEGGSVAGGYYVGALVGENWSGSVVGCHANVAVSGLSRVGGLVGINRGVMDLCYAEGMVVGEYYVGGLAGRNYEGLIQESYAAGRVTGIADVGGLVGQTVDGEVVASFWELDASGMAASSGGQGLNADQMKSPDVFMRAGWDFTELWAMIPGRTRPYLR